MRYAINTTVPETAPQKPANQPVELVKLEIDGQTVEVAKGTTVLEAARSIGVNIPSLCYLKEINEIGACRVCLVEIEGQKALQTSCVYPAAEGLKVKTNTSRVRRARSRVVELLLSNHDRECTTCARSLNCELQNVADNLGLRTVTPTGDAIRYQIHDKNPAIRRDYNKCIHCRRCEAICSKVQECHIYSAQNRGFDTVIAPAFMRDLGDVTCIMCGQCVLACPVGSLTEKEAIDDVWQALENPDLHVVVQTAPSIQVTLGEEFGLPAGATVTGKLVTALRRLGFNQVFATDFAADLTIMEEAHELLQRLEQGNLPLFTSCCPAWIKYCEHHYPHLIPNLSTCKSPMSMFGALTKNYHHNQQDMPKEKMISVAIMPCTAKKFEAARPEHGDEERPDVDFVLTTRELARMIRQAGLDFANLPEGEFDNPLGEHTGAGTIFGATGGVMEAALRTAWCLLAAKGSAQGEDVSCDEIAKETVEFREVRGEKGLKITHVNLDGRDIHIAVVHGIANARKVIEAIEAGEKIDFVEVMACPGGCVGGGGQPILGGRDHKKISLDYRHNRAGALYQIDGKKQIRYSHENPALKKLYKEFLGKPGSGKAHELLHTHYEARSHLPKLNDK